MNSDLKISSEVIQADVPVTVFHLRGWLDGQSEGQILEEARTAHDNGANFLLVDLSELDTLTSAGMRALQKAYQIFTPRDEPTNLAHFKLCSAPPHVYNVLGVTGFLQNIHMYESIDDALVSFGRE
jgi:anti-anti-sigma factor